MRRMLPLVLSCLAACGSREVHVAGTVDEDARIAHVWVVGIAESAEVDDGTFRLPRLPAGPLELRFEDEDGDVYRMAIEALPGGATLTIHDAWVDRAGHAFPGSVSLRGAGRVTINRLHWADPARLPTTFDAEATVLAVGPDGDALLVRPADHELPDLRVVVTPGTVVRAEDGDPVRLRRLTLADTLHLRARMRGGFLIADEIVARRAVARRR